MLGHRVDQSQSGPDSSLGVMFVGARVAEVRQQAIAQVLGYEPPDALDQLSVQQR